MSHINISWSLNRTAAAAVVAGTILASTVTFADPLGYAGPFRQPGHVVEQILPDSAITADQQDATEIASHLRRHIVNYPTREAPGTIIIDTPNTYLYFVLGNGKTLRYGIGVGREGFTWSGVKQVEKKAEWPDWVPPAEMLARQPYLPRFMAGGPGNPLGARAMYLSGSVYRIHGTNAPDTIGKQVSSGCIRMLNEDVVDLYGRVSVGTKVVVLPAKPHLESGLTARGRLDSEARPVIASSNTVRAFELY
jgi:lipoprotein-anchoring transpeptidase ErfK/SrfK